MRAWNKGTTIETIEEGVGPNGEKQVYQIYKFPLGEENGIKLLGGVGLDITENILTQENLLRSNERYDYAARATSDALWDWDIKRNVWLSLTYTPVRDEDKNIIGACIIARDITETKNAEKELDKSQQLFRMFMANTPAMGWIIDDQHKFRYINKKL